MQDMPFTNTMPLSRRALLQKTVLVRRAYLEPENIPGYSKDIDLEDGSYRLGRSSECEIRLSLNNISRVHSRIGKRGEDYILEDENSTNGTYVNGIQVLRCVLRDGDLLEIGEAKLHFFEEKVRIK